MLCAFFFLPRAGQQTGLVKKSLKEGQNKRHGLALTSEPQRMISFSALPLPTQRNSKSARIFFSPERPWWLWAIWPMGCCDWSSPLLSARHDTIWYDGGTYSTDEAEEYIQTNKSQTDGSLGIPCKLGGDHRTSTSSRRVLPRLNGGFIRGPRCEAPAWCLNDGGYHLQHFQFQRTYPFCSTGCQCIRTPTATHRSVRRVYPVLSTC